MRGFMMALGVGCLIVGTEPANAQHADDLRRGAKVRVTTSDGGRTLGSLESVSRDTIALRTLAGSPRGQSARIGRDLIASMEVSKSAPGKGILYGGLLGLLIGGGTGFILGAATYSDDDCFIVCSATEAGAFAGALGAMVSIPIGMIIGGSTRREWRQVDMSRR